MKYTIGLTEKFSQNNYSNNSPTGRFLIDDHDYSDELRDLHNDCSLAGEK